VDSSTARASGNGDNTDSYPLKADLGPDSYLTLAAALQNFNIKSANPGTKAIG